MTYYSYYLLYTVQVYSTHVEGTVKSNVTRQGIEP